MKKIFSTFIILMSFILSSSFAEDLERVSVLARIDSIKKGAMGHSLKAANKEVEKSLKSLHEDQEVILHGHITYQKVQQDSSIQMNPTFIVESVHPISLKKLGKMDDFKLEERPLSFQLSQGPYAPGSIKVTPEVAGAITITASVLLLKSLAEAKGGTDHASPYNNGVIFSAGALATGVLIYDQIKRLRPEN